jgi:hypothetical protein
MTSSAGYGVTPAALVDHAARIESLAGDVATAKQAGDQVQLGAGAYGQLCTIVPMIVGFLQGLVIGGLDDATASLRHTGEQLRSVAHAYEQVEGTVMDDLTRAAGGAR